MKSALVGGKSDVLLSEIQRRATNAFFGYDKLPAVQQRRTTGVIAGTR